MIEEEKKRREEVEELKKQKLQHLEAIEWHIAQVRQLEKQEQIFLESEKPQPFEPDKLKRPCKCDL